MVGGGGGWRARHGNGLGSRWLERKKGQIAYARRGTRRIETRSP